MKFFAILGGVFLIIVVSLLVVYQISVRSQRASTNLSFISEVAGYEVSLRGAGTFNEFLNTTNFYSVEHSDKDRENVYYIDEATITLTDKELPLYRVYYNAGLENEKFKTLSYASDYSIVKGNLNILIYVNPELLESSNPEIITRVNQAINTQIILTLLTSIKPSPEMQALVRADDQSIGEQFIDRFIYEKEKNLLAFELIKN